MEGRRTKGHKSSGRVRPFYYYLYINQFSVVVFKRQHYVFHIFTGYTFVRHFPVLQIHPPPPIGYSATIPLSPTHIFVKTVRY